MTESWGRRARALLPRIAAGGFDVDVAALMTGSQLSKRLLLLRAAVDQAPSAVGAQWDRLAAVERQDAAAVRDVLSYPTVGIWLRRCLVAPRDPKAPWGYFGTLVRRAEEAAGSGEPAPWAAGRLLAPDGPVLEDRDQLRDPGLPQRQGGLRPTAPLDAEAVAAWGAVWRQGATLLRAVAPARADEAGTLLRCVVPLVGVADPERSATFADAFGLILTTRPRGAFDAAAVVVHELQHTKLYAVADLLPLHEPDPTPRFLAPWRHDPRPIGGLLQGLYAHVALGEYWRDAARSLPPEGGRERAAREAVRCREQVGAALPQLFGEAPLTGAGRTLAAGLAARFDLMDR
ncbi:aKG-HExxH-type peptide beta-hydroxylase [Streptacidiphilus jiangxiensis]|uniref:HEXXH motif-containing protein n=1 Tax=Streptacidiphilus jiangxiensis TaxID=235985 RepID=A0A1H7G2W0_STRJI|nr:HEXXH motif-containing putative peptide modification protein [Streptacidiphilus jiangxiensis]SEK32441.1 HEXXH motif-containing protein [Streptacidiphilus jiangxiensis]